MQKIILSIMLIVGSQALAQSKIKHSADPIANEIKRGTYQVVSIQAAEIRCENRANAGKGKIRFLVLTNECVVTLTGVEGNLKETKVVAQRDHCKLNPGDKAELMLTPPVCRESSIIKCSDSTKALPYYEINKVACSVKNKVQYFVQPKT